MHYGLSNGHTTSSSCPWQPHSRRCLLMSSAISCSSSGKYVGSYSSFLSGQAAYISPNLPLISCVRLGNSLLSCEWASWGAAAEVWWLVVTKEEQWWVPGLAFIRCWTRNQFLRSCAHPNPVSSPPGTACLSKGRSLSLWVRTLLG